ncbi:MAG: hypothetical protein VZS44_06700 [Bacilli bacterium]|nr:hypothetical protein [Bacilli bacterium]
MGKNILDDLYICDLYQVDKEIGYLTKGKIGIAMGREAGKKYIKKVGTVIVKKSKLHPFRLKEILTNVPIDTIYEDFRYKTYGWKKEYNTFIYLDPYILDTYYVKVTEDDFYSYCDEHPDTEKYRNELIELLNHGKENHDKMKHVNYLKKQEEEKTELERKNRIKSKIKERTYKRVRKLNNR